MNTSRTSLSKFWETLNNNRGLIFVLFFGILFHYIAYYYVKSFYAHHLPHYDSMGSYTQMFQVVNIFNESGFFSAFKHASAFFLSHGQSFFALVFTPFLNTTPESMQLYNSFSVFVFMLSIFLAAKAAGAGGLKAFVISLMVFLPDVLFDWQGGLLDMRRDPSFLMLLGATFFMFFAYIWRPVIINGILLGAFTGLTVLSRGNAIFFLIGIMGPIFGIWALDKLRSKNYSSIGRFLSLASIPLLILAVPNIVFTIVPNTLRYLNPYAHGSSADNPWISLTAYWNMPLKLFFGRLENNGTLLITCAGFGLIFLLILILRYKKIVSLKTKTLFDRKSVSILTAGFWAIIATLLILCIIDQWSPKSFHSAKPPFFPSLLGSWAILFVIGLSIRINKIHKRRYFVYLCTSIACVIILMLIVIRIERKTPSNHPPDHMKIAHDLVDLFSEDNDVCVAFVWYETLSLDTVNFYMAQNGSTKNVNKFLFKTLDGRWRDFASRHPNGVDLETLLLAVYNELLKSADFVVINTFPNAYVNNHIKYFIFQSGQPVINSIISNNQFETIYTYELWKNKSRKQTFAVLENKLLRK